MSEKRWGVWEQPKDGSANGCWTINTERSKPYAFLTLLGAMTMADAWNKSAKYAHLHHEVRELPEGFEP